MNGLFRDLENEAHFVEFVCAQYRAVPSEISSVMWCDPEVDEDRVRYAHGEYVQSLERFSLFLGSQNPDHFKRSGALLHALYAADCVTNLRLESSAEEVEAGFTRVTRADGEHVLEFLRFFEEYHNEVMAFNTAYKCCWAYQHDAVRPDFDYLHNVCRYLKANSDLTVDSLFMLFKSLMQK